MKSPQIRQHIAQRAQLLFTSGDLDSNGQIAPMLGQIQDSSQSMTQHSPEQLSSSLAAPIFNIKLSDRQLAGKSTKISGDVRHAQQPIIDIPSGSGRPDPISVTPETTDDIDKRSNPRQLSMQHSAWLPGGRRESMNDNNMVELKRVVSSVLRRWWLVLILTITAAGIGYAYSQRIKPVYQATASVIVGQSIEATNLDSRDILTSERLALSYADISRRQPVLNGTVEALGLPYRWQTLRKRVSVGLVPDTQLLEISVEADSREEAVRIANEIAQQLISLSPASLQNQEVEASAVFVQQRLLDLQTRIEDNNNRLVELAELLSEARTDEQKAEIQVEINYLEEMAVGWENTYARYLGLSGSKESANYLAVVDDAYAKVSPIRPSIRLNTIIAAVVGSILAVGVIFVLEVLDDTLKTEDDIAQDLNLTPLGSIGRFERPDFIGQLIVAKEPFSPASESYRMIRNNIQFMSIDKPGRSILVTSPTPGEGKSSTAINLAIAMAQNGYRTILVDADMRKPTLHEVFRFPRGIGLTNQFRSLDPGENIPLWETEINNLQLLTAGELPPNPSELLGSQRMDIIVSSLKDKADMIIIDSPPAAFIADATVLSKRVDGVVIVVSAGKTRRDVARRAVFNLQQSGANILGVVLNRAPAKNGRYKYYAAEEQSGQIGNRIPDAFKNTWNKVTFANRRNG